MKNSKKILFLLSILILSGTVLLNACSKKEKDDPSPDLGAGTASATIEFLDSGEKIQFNGIAQGVRGGGNPDTVIMNFSGKDHPLRLTLMITPVAEGTSRMREKGFSTFGFLHPDTTQSTNYFNAFLVGEDNIDDNGLDQDGEAAFTISSFSNKRIKGTFELTMIQNTTIKENGVVVSGQINQLKVTNGKFDVPLN